MNYFTLFGIFFILWWIVFFIVLPLNITTHMDRNIDIEGIHGSVPINPNLLYKLIITTFVSIIILSPDSINGGTCMCKPLSKIAGLYDEETVCPFKAASVISILHLIWLGRTTEIGFSL